MLEIKNLPETFKELWEKCLPLLEQGRDGDAKHAKDVAEFILNYEGQLNFDLDILIPVAMMHDIGHSAILEEHFWYVTGLKKLTNGKLVHMLVGAKIARDLLNEVGYPKDKAKEIVDIISVHDSDQLDVENPKQAYNTETRKIFYDVDIMDRFTKERLEKFSVLCPDKEKLLQIIKNNLNDFFFEEFKKIAEERFKKLS